MLQLSCSVSSRRGVNLALMPSLARRFDRLVPSLSFSRCYSLQQSASTPSSIAYHGDGVGRTNMIPTNSTRNMSSLLPSVMRGNLGATGCDLAHVTQLVHRQGHVLYTGDLDNVQEEVLSEEERTQLQTEMELLEGRILEKREEIRCINRIMDQTLTELEALEKEIAAGEKCLHSLKNDKLEEVLDEFPLLESNIQDLRSRTDKSQAIKDYLANQVKVRKEKEQMFAQSLALRLAAITGRNALEAQLTEIRTRLLPVVQANSDFSASESSLIGKEPHPKRKERWIQLNKIFARIASEEERTQLQTQMHLLEGCILEKREEFRCNNRIIDRTLTELEALEKEIAAGEKCLHSLKNDKLEEVLDEFPLLESNIQDLRSRTDKSQAITDYLANRLKVCQEKVQMSAQVSALQLAAITGRKALEEQLAEIRTRLQTNIDFSASESSLIGKAPDPKRKERWMLLNKIIARNAEKATTNASAA